MKATITRLTLIIVIITAVHVSHAETMEYVTQILEPTGGKIVRPKDWYYAESHRAPAFIWTLSKEDSRRGQPYITGVKVQTFLGVKKGTGKSPREFVLDFANNKKKSVDKVIKTCRESDQGLFTRSCLETEEGPFRILYSMFWGTNNLDIVVISISGTTKELWSKFSPVFDKMSTFDLIDMNRFKQ